MHGYTFVEKEWDSRAAIARGREECKLVKLFFGWLVFKPMTLLDTEKSNIAMLAQAVHTYGAMTIKSAWARVQAKERSEAGKQSELCQASCGKQAIERVVRENERMHNTPCPSALTLHVFHRDLSSLRLIRSHLHEWVGLSFGCSFDLPLCQFVHSLIGMTVTHFSKSSTTSFLVLIHFKRLSLDFCQKLKTNQWIPLIFITKIQSCQHSYAGTQQNRASYR